MSDGNYDKFKEQGRVLFHTFNQEDIIQRFHLQHSEEAIQLTFLGKPYCIDRKTSEVYYAEDQNASVPMVEAMTIYDILTKTPDRTPELAGEWVTLQQLGGIIATGHLQRLDAGSSAAELFRGKTDELEQACLRLNGQKMTHGDVSYVLPLFDFFPVWLQFWDGDEEFAPNMQYLWDKNTFQFLHYETLWYVMEILETRFKDLLQQ